MDLNNRPTSFGKERIMKKSASLLALMLMMFGLTAQAAASPDTFADAKVMAKELNKPLLLDFFTTW